MVWQPMFGIFNMHTDVDACNDTKRLCEQHKRACTESWLWDKNPLPHQGWTLEPTSVLHLASQSDALPTEHSPSIDIIKAWWRQARKYAHQKKGGKRPCLKILPALPIIGKQLVFADFAHQELPLDQGQPHLLHDLHHVFCAFLWGIFKPADHSCVDILFFANLEWSL